MRNVIGNFSWRGELFYEGQQYDLSHLPKKTLKNLQLWGKISNEVKENVEEEKPNE